jgi:hypothetical protein
MLQDPSFSLERAVADRKLILLFYKEFEKDKFLTCDRYLKRVVRPIYNLTHTRQKKTGFGVIFELLKRALEKQGWVVRIRAGSCGSMTNAVARRHPEYPVALIGFSTVLEGWNLPNPAILGPCLFDHPMLAPRRWKILDFAFISFSRNGCTTCFARSKA